MGATEGATFAEFARGIARRHVAEETIQGALQAMGGKAECGWSQADPDRRSALIGHFVRSMRNVGVHAANRIEGELLAAAGGRREGRRVQVLRDAISLIAVRNQIHQTITSLGAGWNGSMRYQSALSDIARTVIERGGGRIELEEGGGSLSLWVYCAADLGPVSTVAGHAPGWLAATLNLTKEIRVNRSGSGSLIEIKFEKPTAMVA